MAIRDFAAADRDPLDCLLVAEDDVNLPEDLDGIMEAILKTREPFGIAVLGEPFGGAARFGWVGATSKAPGMSLFSDLLPRPLPLGSRLGRYSGACWGASLNLITHEAARRYVANLDSQGGKPAWLADDYWVWAGDAGVEIRLLRPNLVTWFGESTLTPGFDNAQMAAGRSFNPREIIALRTRLMHAKHVLRASLDDLRRRNKASRSEVGGVS